MKNRNLFLILIVIVSLAIGIFLGYHLRASPKVNINTATKSELDALEGIGEVKSSKIIENRPYKSVDELLEKECIGKTTFNKIKDRLEVR